MSTNKEICRFITCGSVDDGKSTLIGRLLYDSKNLFKDQADILIKDSSKNGRKQEDILDFSLLLDGLISEREQKITIDVAYIFFNTSKRKFIVADTPGHEQYTRNMATGASTADIAIILIDARYGILPQTKRHSFIVALLGIKNIIVAINKMDLVNFSQDIFNKIKFDYEEIISHLPYNQTITFNYIPISALYGDNVVKSSPKTTWFSEQPLLSLLDNIHLYESKCTSKEDYEKSHCLRFPVQYVNRPNLDFRGYCGSIVSGNIKIGDNITVLPSLMNTTVKEIISTESGNCKIQQACFPMAITLTLKDEIDISRGNLIVHSNNLVPQITKNFSAMIIWMHLEPLILHKSYIIKLATSQIKGTFIAINYKKNINNFSETNTTSLHMNDIGKCDLQLEQSLTVDLYIDCKSTGSFIIIDRYSNDTLGAGIITDITKIDHKNQFDDKNMRKYTKSEKALNAYIRKKFPEWKCRAI